MKKKLISTLMVSIFLFVVGINGVRADDPVGESVAPTGQSLPAGEADDSTPPSENVNPTGQAEEAPPVEDNSGVSGESTVIPGQAEEAPPVQLVDISTSEGKYSLLGIDGTVKEYKCIFGTEKDMFIVLTDANKIYFGYIKAGVKGDITMKEVTFESTSQISKLSIYDSSKYTANQNEKGLDFAVKLSNGKVYPIVEKKENNNTVYYVNLTTECAEDDNYKDLKEIRFVKQLVSITNKESNIKAILSADEKNFNNNSSLLVKVYNNNEEHYKLFESAIKKLLGNYSKIKLFNIKLSNTNDDGPLQPSSIVKIIIPIPNGYDKNNLSIYHLEDNGNLEKIDSTIDGNNIVFYANHFSLYGIVETNGKQNTITNPKTGNYIPYTFGLLFIIISSVGLFALKNRKVFNK